MSAGPADESHRQILQIGSGRLMGGLGRRHGRLGIPDSCIERVRSVKVRSKSKIEVSASGVPRVGVDEAHTTSDSRTSMPAVEAPRVHVQIRPAKGWAALRLGELWEFREVGLMLAWRDVQLRYKQTMLGIVWVVLQPLLAGLIFAVIFGRFAQLPSGGQPYFLFVFAGLLVWNLFAGIVQRAGPSLVAEARLITKVYFPRILVPVAAAGAVLIDFAVSWVVMLSLMVWYGIMPGMAALLTVPLALLTVVLGLGVALWVSALHVRYRDFGYALPFLLQVWMFASPIVYGLELVPTAWRGWFVLNPLAGLVEAQRAVLLKPAAWPGAPFAISAVIAVVVLIGGIAFFRRVEREFADWL